MTAGKDSNYDWGNIDKAYLDIKDANSLELPLYKYMCRRYLNLSHVVSITLLKIKIVACGQSGRKRKGHTDIKPDLQSDRECGYSEAIQNTTRDSQGQLVEVIKVLKLHANSLSSCRRFQCALLG